MSLNPSKGEVELFDILVEHLESLHKAGNESGRGSLSRQTIALKRLMGASSPSDEVIEDIFGKLGFDVDRERQLAVIEVTDPGERPKTYQANAICEYSPGTLATVIDDKIVALAESRTFADRSNAMFGFCKDVDCTVGISSVFTDLKSLQTACKQANYAMRTGSRISDERLLEKRYGIRKRYPDKYFYFNDYLFHELISHYPMGLHGFNPGRDLLSRLVEHDKRKGGEKTSFLYTYLGCNCSAKETAEFFGIHRNSVRYQLKTIEELLGVDVRDIDFICHIRLAFASIEVIGQSSAT